MTVSHEDRPTLIIAGTDPGHHARYEEALEGYALQFTASGDEALTGASLRPFFMIIGPHLHDMQPVQLLARLRERNPVGERVYAVGDWAADIDDVFYASRLPIESADLRLLVESALSPANVSAPPTAGLDAQTLRRILDSARRLAVQRDMAGTERVLATAAGRLVSADRSHCRFHDEDSGVLWTETEPEDAETSEVPACRSICGFAVRVRRAISVERLDRDARYHAFDNPRGEASDRLLAQPIVGPDGEVHAVVVVTRVSKNPVFSAQDMAALRQFAEHIGPLLQSLSLQIQTQATIEELEPHQQIFRPEAMTPRRRAQGDVLRITPPWIAKTYWSVVGMVIASAIYMVIGTINQYSSGVAIVRFSGTTEVPATVEGTVTTTLVHAGQNVEKGDPLVRLHDASQRAELDRLEREFERNVAVSLQDPANAEARRRLGELRAAIERARAAMDERTVRAPHGGTVVELRARSGEQLQPGVVVASIAGDEAKREVLAFLPGDDQPQIKPGQPLRFEVQGFRYAYQNLRVASIGSEAVGPDEARRLLGDRLADSVELSGPVVVVRAKLPGSTFDSDGHAYRYFDGMHGSAKLRLRQERIVFALIPGLKRTLEHWATR